MPAGPVIRAAHVAQPDDLHAALVGQAERRDRADIAEALHHGGAFARQHLQQIQRALDEIDDAAARRLAPPHGAADGHRLARDDLRHGVTLVHRPRIHEPRHHLLVGAHIRADDVGMRPDKGDHLLHVAARKRLQLARRKLARIDRHAALRAAVRAAR